MFVAMLGNQTKSVWVVLSSHLVYIQRCQRGRERERERERERDLQPASRASVLPNGNAKEVANGIAPPPGTK